MSVNGCLRVIVFGFIALVGLLVVLCNTGALRVLVGLFAS